MTAQPKYALAITQSEDRFRELGSELNYARESIFAGQLLTKNEFSTRVANQNPRSVQLAMLNVASTGLTLNPALGFAYLVPRDGVILLDISYKGLLKIATDSGAILWGRADVVHEHDQFTYHGPAKEPEIVADPFGERGDIIGVYCIAKTRDGDILTEVMTLKEIETVRGKSDLYQKKQSGPWVEFFAQMCKKACIKRAAKTWPNTGHSGKLFEAIEIANASEGGYTFDAPAITVEDTRKADHDAAAEQYSETITSIKDEIVAAEDEAQAGQREQHVEVARALYRGIPVVTRGHLWLAPSKGGCFTTAERTFIRENL